MRVVGLNELEGKTIEEIELTPLVYKFRFTDGTCVHIGIGGRFSNAYLSWMNEEDI